MSRNVIIGVMGGNRSAGALAKEALDIGAAVVRSGSILLTGGYCTKSNDIKDAAMQGAKNESAKYPDRIARLIGILPNEHREWDERIPYTLFLRTALGSVERDPITGATPDTLIFFAGSCGTLCELAFALQANRKILLWNAASKLLGKYDEHTRVDNELTEVLQQALHACKTKLTSVPGITVDTTVAILKTSLSNYLATAKDFNGSPDQLVAAAIKLTGIPGRESGFPGFSDDPQSKKRFEEIVIQISG